MVTQKALFFLRHYNDIDHIVPVIYKWLSLENVPTDVVIATNREYLDDYRIQFLRQFKDLGVHFIDEFLSEEQRQEKEVKKRIEQMYSYHPVRIAYKLRNKISASSSQNLYNSLFIERILDKVFEGADKGIVAFDWLSMKASHLNFVRQFVQAARNRGFVSLALPHGDSPHFNRMIRLNELDYSCMDHYASGTIFDYVVVPNELCARRYRPYMNSNRIKVLGSPRYNDEWLNTLATLIPSYETKKGAGKLKIVCFLRNSLYPIFWEEVIRALKIVTQFPELYLIVKHHTRDAKLKKLLKEYPELNSDGVFNLEFVYDQVHSSSLLQWADVVMDLGTSVAFEAVKRGKPVLAMEYLHAGYSTVAYYIKSSAMWCRDDLYDTIQAFVENKEHQLHDEKERKRFIHEMIDVPDVNILERYVQFLKHCLTERG